MKRFWHSIVDVLYFVGLVFWAMLVLILCVALLIPGLLWYAGTRDV